MTDEEHQILNFLKAAPETEFTRREIARKAVRRQVFEQNPHWIDIPLASLLAKGEVEQVDNGAYRLAGDGVLRVNS